MSPLLFFLGGLALLVVGGELLVRGATRLAAALGVSPLVIGLTVVAFGTSAPELAVSLLAALRGQAGLAVGNVVGSNIFNVLAILGVSALLTPLVVAVQLVRIEVPLMIAASLAVPLLAADGAVSRLDGLLLFGAGVTYTVLAIRSSRAEANAGEGAAAPGGGVMGSLGLVVCGLVLLVLGARWLVAAASVAAQALGVSDLVVGLTVVAAGTSLPEAAASIAAALRGQRDIAVGNVVGSNLFNILVVLGGAALVAPGGVPMPVEAMRLDIPVMIAVAIACLPIFASGGHIDRWEGALFLACYGGYTAALVFAATPDRPAAWFSPLMLGLALPLVALTLAVMAWQSPGLRRSGR
jgi:cation:H+ antiporter